MKRRAASFCFSLWAALIIALSCGGTARGAEQRNTRFGNSALANNTFGTDNTAFGFFALFSNTTGLNNTATGEAALEANTTGLDNTATGEGRLKIIP